MSFLAEMSFLVLQIANHHYEIFESGIVARDGLVGLYRGFIPNALKTLPNSRLFSPSP